MTKVYEKYDDLHVRKTYIYVKNANAYAYLDAAKTVKISAADLKDLFLKGAVILDGTIEYTPVSYGIATGVGTLTYVKTNGTTPTTADLATLKSSEYVA